MFGPNPWRRRVVCVLGADSTAPSAVEPAGDLVSVQLRSVPSNRESGMLFQIQDYAAFEKHGYDVAISLFNKTHLNI